MRQGGACPWRGALVRSRHDAFCSPAAAGTACTSKRPMKRPRLGLRLRRAARVLTPDGFALAPLWVQLAAIFTSSALVILLLAPFIGDLGTSYRFFSDPSSYADAEGFRQLFFGFVQVGFGLLLFSFIISVLSSALEQLIERIRGGTLPYRKRSHLLIVNRNAKLPLILDEIDARYAAIDQAVDVVVLLGNREEVGDFSDSLHLGRWPFLHLYVRQGDLLDFETYQRVSIFSAAGVVLLANDRAGGTFASDNLNLKILTTLVNDPAYWGHLTHHHEQRRPLKCAVELSSEVRSREVAQGLTALGREALFSVTTPGDVIGRILSRSIIDLVFYKLYDEILSAGGHSAYFVNPRKIANGPAAGTSFEEVSRRFTRGILAGFSHNDAGGFTLRLAPAGQLLGEGDWLIVIARSPADIIYGPPTAAATAPVLTVTPPSEIRRRRLCVVGNARTFESLADFLHGDSRTDLAKSHFIHEEAAAYFTDDFIARLRTGGYDNLVINLDDETGFRFTLHLEAQLPPDDPLRERIVTVLTDPVIEELLNRRSKHRRTILPDKLAAKYITQLSFQKNLEKLYDELSAPEGMEFNLLEVGRHIPATALTSKPAVKDLLLAHGLVYVGTVDEHKEVQFDADDLTGARQIVVISSGDI